jgi:predicted ArsR family transcriptional regulator
VAKEEILDWVARFLGATRARLLELLRRSAAPISDLADALGITGNAVRGHVAALQRDGLVSEAGMAPSAGGKPAQLYTLTAEGEELFPKAYAVVLTQVIEALRERDGDEATADFLNRVGRRAAGGASAPDEPIAERVASAADALRALGGDVQIVPVQDGWELRGFGCPLSAVVLREPEACRLAQGILEQVTHARVTECCDRSGERPRCAFRVER